MDDVYVYVDGTFADETICNTAVVIESGEYYTCYFTLNERAKIAIELDVSTNGSDVDLITMDDLNFEEWKDAMAMMSIPMFNAGYADKDGNLRINFISNNDITGGNSGSPVINAWGEIVGTAFDGNWEAMSGDIAFENEIQRTISVDIRYTMFIIDKFAGATHLIDEMTIIE